MDRSILLSNLHTGAHPELGVKIACARDPVTLTRQVQAYIDAAATGGISSPFVQGFELAGGGAGDSCQAILTITKNLGWGLFTSVPCLLARVLFRRANSVTQLRTVIDQMYVDIAASGGSDAFVWQPRIVGTGRDGSFLIGMLWCDGTIGSLHALTYNPATQGPFVAAQTLLSITTQQCPGANWDTDMNWHVTWGALVNDVAGTGVKLRLEIDGGLWWEHDTVGAATSWESVSGERVFSTSPVADVVHDLIIEPRVPGNAVNVRQTILRAEICNYNNNPS